MADTSKIRAKKIEIAHSTGQIEPGLLHYLKFDISTDFKTLHAL